MGFGVEFFKEGNTSVVVGCSRNVFLFAKEPLRKLHSYILKLYRGWVLD